MEDARSNEPKRFTNGDFVTLVAQETQFSTQLDLLGNQINSFKRMIGMIDKNNWNDSSLSKEQFHEKLRTLVAEIGVRAGNIGSIFESQIEPKLKN